MIPDSVSAPSRKPRILVLIGSPSRVGNANKLADRIEAGIRSAADCDIERIQLSAVPWKACLGCHSCIIRGEDTCPLGDGFPGLRRKVEDADGLVLVTPVYCMGVSYLMKQCLDRFAYLWHRPRFFGKKAIVACVGAGAGPVAKPVLSYMADNLARWGASVVGKVGVMRFDTPLTPNAQAAREAEIIRVSSGLARAVADGRLPPPGITDLVWFNLWRTAALTGEKTGSLDYRYWKERGWLDPACRYYYRTRINPVHQLMVWAGMRAAALMMRRVLA